MLEFNAIYGSAFGCIIENLRGLRIQVINSCRVCPRLRHGSLDISQCGGHARAIADYPSHLQRARFHVITGNLGSTDGSHTFQLLAVSRELTGFVLQSGDLAFIRGDTVSSGKQITLIRFISKRGIQCCNRSLICLIVQRIIDIRLIRLVVQRIIDIRLIRLVVQCIIDIRLIRLVVQCIIDIRLIRLICQFRIDIRLCSIRVTSIGFTQFIVIQIGDVRCIRSNIVRIGFQSQFCI